MSPTALLADSAHREVNWSLTAAQKARIERAV